MKRENRVFLFLLVGFFLVFSYFRQNQRPSSSSQQKIFSLKGAEPTLCFSTYSSDFSQGKYYYLAQKKGQWEKIQQYGGVLRGILQEKELVYVFFQHHYCSYEKKALRWDEPLKTVDYPSDFTPLATAYHGEKLFLWGRENKKIRLIEIKTDQYRPVKISLEWPKSATDFASLWQGDWGYLFYSSPQGVFYYSIQGEKTTGPFATSLKKGPLGVTSRDGYCFLFGGAKKRGDGKLQLRFLMGKMKGALGKKIDLIPQPDLILPISTEPSSLSCRFFGENLFLFIGRDSQIFYTFLQRDRWSPCQSLYSFVPIYLSPPLRMAMVLLFVIFLLALLVNFLQKKVKPSSATKESLDGTDPLFRPPAPFWKRGCAYGVDLFLLGIGLSFFVTPPADLQNIPVNEALHLFVIFYLVSLPYFIFCDYLFGKSLGKYLAKLKVVGWRGRPSLSEAIVRNFLRILDDSGFWPGCVGMISLLFTPKNQRVGDLVAGTMVVEEERGWEPQPST